MRSSKHWTPHWLIIVLLPFLLFWRWVLLGELLFWGTPLFQFWPWHHLVKRSILAGQWPLWNPLLGNGTPLLANLQSAVFYPFNLLYLLLPIEHGLTLSVILHLSLAALFMYFYARHIGLLPFAATVSAVAYSLSGYLVGRTQFVTMINSAAWLPLVLLLCERIVARRTWLDVIWLGLVLAGQLLAGHAQLWFYTLLLSGAYIIFRSWQKSQPLPNLKAKVINLLQIGWQFVAASGLALLLSAAQILPTAEFTILSSRSSGADRYFALTYSFWPWRLITLLAPNFFGHPAEGSYWGYANYWEDHAYLGLLPFLLMALAIGSYFRGNLRNSVYGRIIPFFAALIPVSLVLAMGWNTPIYLWIFDNLPGFKYFQAPARLLIWYTVAVAVLAGIGAQSFEVTPQSRPTWRRLLVASLGLAIAGLAGGLVLAGRNRTFLTATSALGIWLAGSIALLLLHPDKERQMGRRHHPLLWQWGIITFVAVDLLWAAVPLNPTLPPAIYNRPIASAEFLKTHPGDYRFFVDKGFDRTIKFDHYFRFETFGPREIDYWLGLRETLVPNFGVYADLLAANNDDPLVVGHWRRLLELLEPVDQAERARLLSLMNVGYLVDDGSQSPWPTIYENPEVAIQQLPQPLPRAYFVPNAFKATNEAEVIARLTSSEFDPHQEVVIMEGDTPEPVHGFEEVFGSNDLPDDENDTSALISVLVSEQTPLRLLLDVEAPVAGFVVLTDTFYPGWQVTVDGQPAVIWPANLAFRAVAVDAGTHKITFSYRPRSFTIGLWVSGITLLIIVAAAGLLVITEGSRNRP